MAASDKVSSGEAFRPPLAQTWNAMVDAGEAHRTTQLSKGEGGPLRRRETDRIKCRNDSGAARRRGEILGAFTNPLTNLEADKLRLAGDAPGVDDYFGILLKATPDGEYGELQLSGVCIALVDIDEESHARAKCDGSGHVLVSANDGPIEILFSPSGTGEQECVVRFDTTTAEIGGWLLKTTTEIGARTSTNLGTGYCIVCHRSNTTIVETEEEIVAYNSQGGDPIPAGAYVQAKLWQGIPLIDVVECPAEEEEEV